MDVVARGVFLFSSPGFEDATPSTLPSVFASQTSLSMHSCVSQVSSLANASSEAVTPTNISASMENISRQVSTPRSLPSRAQSDNWIGQRQLHFSSSDVVAPHPLKWGGSRMHSGYFPPMESYLKRLPEPVMGRIASYLDPRTYRALCEVCQLFDVNTTDFPSPIYPLSMRMPTEILHLVYDYLAPKYFNAARRTCTFWFRASLDNKLLIKMLTRGGWYSGAVYDLALRMLDRNGDSQRAVRKAERALMETNAWFFSCRLSLECTLSSSWTGNGIEDCFNVPSMAQTLRVDFSELASGYGGPEAKEEGGLILTASSCGDFVMVAEGGMIYVYELTGNDLFPLTSVVCPRRVLAMSMDVSCRRYAVAALLDGRMGLVCDLTIGEERAIVSPPKVKTPRSHSSVATEEVSAMSAASSSLQENRDDADSHSIDSNALTALGKFRVNKAPFRGVRRVRSSQPHRFFDENSRGIPIEDGPRSIYRHLCSDDDPPRSVAICPQRQCVAYGCFAGVELHWIDAQSRQHMNRWFPLTGPSDFLYFLPPRANIDSPKKLRVISSAAHHSQRSDLSNRLYSARSTPHPYVDTLELISRNYDHFNTADHYRAVPLSDGYHILYVDPPSGYLCLGGDSPRAEDRRRLLRKFVMLPPQQNVFPRIYAVGTDLAQGPKIVAVYGDLIVLYSIPADAYLASLHELQRTSRHNLPGTREVAAAEEPGAAHRRASNHEWLEWWPREMRCPPSVGLGGGPAPQGKWWPIYLEGSIVGDQDGVVDLAVSQTAGLAIWGFGRDGKAKVWQVNNGRRHGLPKELSVSRDGEICDWDWLYAESFAGDMSEDGGMKSYVPGGREEYVEGMRRSEIGETSFYGAEGEWGQRAL
ncbi:hypothetical protein EJ06DRAFT_552723 [Trichodelitschia bisporula]|uniref:F-box domain-containing protein n=1 Tax=Trichodelitschia bisporula TaxID=703511 RepID=A0A6G1IB64_9PEZI|nr:hypothetical protein EJ06DRAFT_552723 [Trichodelitschia bisporula]